MRSFKKIFASFILFSLFFSGFSATFNDNLTSSEKETIEKGEILIKKINYNKYISLSKGISESSDELLSRYRKLNPKYLAEVIQLKPYEGNEDLPERMMSLLENISAYAGIPYWSERHERFWDLYSSAELISENETDSGKVITARIDMEPFGVFNQKITIEKEDEVLFYDSENLDKLNYEGIDVVFKGKMKMSILLFRDGDNWVLYGIGGVNAPRIPFLTQRIDTSFINRIKTFCNYIFEKL